MKRLAVITIAAAALVGCSSSESESDRSGGGEFEWCGISGPGISEDTDISTLDTVGYGGPGSDYCMGFEYVYWQRNTDLVKEACADNFWGTSDDEILRLFMSPDGGSNGHDYSIGMIDGLWTVC